MSWRPLIIMPLIKLSLLIKLSVIPADDEILMLINALMSEGRDVFLSYVSSSTRLLMYVFFPCASASDNWSANIFPLL